uniref:Uncharacterized protein n=1 Tax=Panagrolaimus superbus TaxID=310955 RepID=A0A914YMP7_9BILA
MICVTVLKLAKIYKEQYPDCNKTHIFDPEEGRKLLDLHKQKIGTHPIELQIRKRPRQIHNRYISKQSCSTNSPLQDIIAANEDVERWRERRRRSMNRTSESEIIIEESKPLYSSINCCEPLHVQAPSPPPLSLPNLITHPYLKVCVFIDSQR